MRITVDDGVGLDVTVHGSGPGLLLVHGFGGAKEDFADHVTELATGGHTVVTFDHRGHGESDAPGDVAAYSLDRLAADVIGVASAVDLDRFVLLGHSMGGMVARRVVLAHPERVAALVLMDTSAGPVAGLDPALMEAAAQIAIDDGKDALKPLLDAAATLQTPAYRRTLDERPGYQEFEERKWAALSAVMWGAMARDLARQPDQLDALRGVTCPTLVLVGAEDSPFVAGSRAMAAAIPGAELVVIPEAGHSPQFENPDAWRAALCGFLAALPATATGLAHQ